MDGRLTVAWVSLSSVLVCHVYLGESSSYIEAYQ